MQCSDERLGPLEAAASSYSENHAQCVGIVFVLPSPEGGLSKVKEECGSKRAMNEKGETWQNKEEHGKAKYRWQQPSGEDGGKSSHDVENFVSSQLERDSAKIDAV